MFWIIGTVLVITFVVMIVIIAVRSTDSRRGDEPEEKVSQSRASKEELAKDFAQMLPRITFEFLNEHPSASEEDCVNMAMDMFSRKHGLSMKETADIVAASTKYLGKLGIDVETNRDK